MKREIKLEQFYTQKHLAEKCWKLLLDKVEIENYKLIIEPSAGDGAFFDLMPVNKRVGIDVAPRHDLIVKQDFFSFSVDKKKIMIVGNPPFGARGSLAMKFMKKATELADVIAFILPRSFKKDTFMNKIDPYFHLIDQFDCDEFRSPEGEHLTVKSVFQIWIKKNAKRVIINRKASHPDFELKHVHVSQVSPQELHRIKKYYDFTIPQVGSNFAPRSMESVNAGSHWCVKILNPNVSRKWFERLNFDFAENMNTTFMSLSKKDIVQAYENLIELE